MKQSSLLMKYSKSKFCWLPFKLFTKQENRRKFFVSISCDVGVVKAIDVLKSCQVYASRRTCPPRVWVDLTFGDVFICAGKASRRGRRGRRRLVTMVWFIAILLLVRGRVERGELRCVEEVRSVVADQVPSNTQGDTVEWRQITWIQHLSFLSTLLWRKCWSSQLFITIKLAPTITTTNCTSDMLREPANQVVSMSYERRYR